MWCMKFTSKKTIPYLKQWKLFNRDVASRQGSLPSPMIISLGPLLTDFKSAEMEDANQGVEVR